MYTINELKILQQPLNHKIEFDGYDYWWYSNLNGWRLHCIKPFDSHLKALYFIKYWLFKYSEMVANNDATFDKMINDVINQVEIHNIAKSDMKTLKKVELMLEINPRLTQVEISELLDKSKMAISKACKKLKYA